MSCKVIVTGSINGHFGVFNKLSKLHEKNAFSLALISGDLFADPKSASDQNANDVAALVSGKIEISFPTYFVLAKNSLPPNVVSKLEASDGELCANLYFLGKRSVTKLSEGIRVVTLGGSLHPELTTGLSRDEYDPFYTEADAKSLHGAHNADFLVTCQWPAAIRSGSKAGSGDTLDLPSETGIADLCSALKPRYHFSISDDFFFEREPFFHVSQGNSQDTLQVTRFISLAAYGNHSKHKWLYAFSIDPSAAQNSALPAGTTASPFSKQAKKHQSPYSLEGGHHRFSRQEPYGPNERGTKSSKARGPPPGPESCFFCLSNPNLATHLITSIGNDSYLTTAKGPLPTTKTFPSLGFPGHILIIPLSHSPTFANISPLETRISSYEEMSKYRRSLDRLLASASKGFLGSVTWEISRDEGVHIHWQLLPLPADLVSKGLVEAAFRVEAENEGYEAFQIRDIGDGSQIESDFLRVWMWRNPEEAAPGDAGYGAKSEEKEISMVLEIRRGSRFDLQFPRKVMAKLLGLESRFHWKDCSQTEAEEAAEAEAFKVAFKPFDFS